MVDKRVEKRYYSYVNNIRFIARIGFCEKGRVTYYIEVNTLSIFIRKLHISKFRNFSETDIYFGEYVTAIAGQNGVGKSNILGLVANCIQYKKAGRQKVTLFTPKLFRAEFHELFKGSQEYDKSGSNLLCFTFSDGDTRKCRITWQKKKLHGETVPRFRIIPYVDQQGGERSHSKKEIAPIYLGLSRLYPVGESDDCQVSNLRILDKNATEWIAAQAEHILSMKFSSDNSTEVDGVKVGDAKRKNGIGFKGDSYDALANSAGQDNLGQILLAVWKIKYLKESLNEVFPGAALIIDEFEATLHPASQKKLLELLMDEAKKTGFQVIFTTHSTTLLKLLSLKNQRNTKSPDEHNNIEVNYLTTANGPLVCYRNPPYSIIETDLDEQTAHYPKKVKIYTEDQEARWFLHHLLDKLQFSKVVQVLDDVKMSCTTATNLIHADNAYFKNTLFVLDGDFRANNAIYYKNIILLPGCKRPETVIMDFLCSDEARPFCSPESVAEQGYSIRNFQNKRDEIRKESTHRPERELYKEWFNEHYQTFDSFHLFEYWAECNKDAVSDFREKFIKAYNDIASRLSLKVLR